MNEGTKHDEGKLPWHLVPWDAMRGVVAVLKFGAEKYAPRNWEKGMAFSRLERAAINHITSWSLREAADEETSISHLYHAICCLLFLAAYELRGVGIDDRPRLTQEAAPNDRKPRQGKVGEKAEPLVLDAQAFLKGALGPSDENDGRAIEEGIDEIRRRAESNRKAGVIDPQAVRDLANHAAENVIARRGLARPWGRADAPSKPQSNEGVHPGDDDI